MSETDTTKPAPDPVERMADAIAKAMSGAKPLPVNTQEQERSNPFRKEEEVPCRPTPHRVQPGTVMRSHATRRDGTPFPYANREYKVATVDWYTRMFTVFGPKGAIVAHYIEEHPRTNRDDAERACGFEQDEAKDANRTLSFSFDDFEAQSHRLPMDLDDPEVMAIEAERQAEHYRKLAADKKAVADVARAATAPTAAFAGPVRKR